MEFNVPDDVRTSADGVEMYVDGRYYKAVAVYHATRKALDEADRAVSTAAKSGRIVAHGDHGDDADGYIFDTEAVVQSPLVDLVALRDAAKASLEYAAEQ